MKSGTDTLAWVVVILIVLFVTGIASCQVQVEPQFEEGTNGQTQGRT